ncbi:hypothetical protein ES705_29675 [subsurface metagenome]
MEAQGAEKERKCQHWWIIDEKDIGHCKYCPAVRNFGKEQEAWLRRHKEAVRALGAIGVKRSLRPWNK